MIIIHDVNRLQGYRERIMAPRIEEALRNHPVVVLVGARQTGKSTLAQRISPERTYVTLDDLDRLDQARREPAALLAAAPRLTIDEVQRAPELFLAIKREVDRRRTPGRFLLTGSASLDLFSHLAGALAGRAAAFALLPLTCGERASKAAAGAWDALMEAKTLEDARDAITRPSAPLVWEPLAVESGFPPATLAATARTRIEWFEAFVATYIERDLRQLSQVAHLSDFRRLMSVTALRTGQIGNQAEIARDVALAQPTAHRYLNLLEASGLLVRLAPWAANPTKRLIKTPKIYWADSGLAAFLARLASADDLRSSTLRGAILENLVLSDLLAWRETRAPQPELSHWRTPAGLEVDLVVKAGRRVLPIEVKASSAVSTTEAKGLEAFLDDLQGKSSFGVLVYNGTEVRPLTSRVLLVPLAAALGA